MSGTVAYRIVVLGLTAAAASGVQDSGVEVTGSVDPGTVMAQMMARGEELATVGIEHEWLAQMAGDWETEMSFMGVPGNAGSPGTAHAEMVYGGRFLEIQFEGPFMGQQFSSRSVIGFDNYKKKYTAVFFDSLGTSMRTAEGMLGRDRTSLSLWGVMDEWMTGQHDCPVMYRCRVVDPTHFILEIHDLSIVSGQAKVIELNCRRKLK